MARYSNASLGILIAIALGLGACAPRVAQNPHSDTQPVLRLASLSNPGNPFELHKGVRTESGDPFEVPLRETCQPLVGPTPEREGWLCSEENILRALGPLSGQWKATANSTSSAGCWMRCAGSDGNWRNEPCLVDLLGGSCYCGACP